MFSSIPHQSVIILTLLIRKHLVINIHILFLIFFLNKILIVHFELIEFFELNWLKSKSLLKKRRFLNYYLIQWSPIYVESLFIGFAHFGTWYQRGIIVVISSIIEIFGDKLIGFEWVQHGIYISITLFFLTERCILFITKSFVFEQSCNTPF